MWFIGKSLLAYLLKDNIKEKERLSLLKKRIKLIKLEVNNLKDEELIDYLLNPKTPEEVIELICERINNYANSVYSSEREKVNKLNEIFKSKKQFSINHLKLTSFPKEFKRTIIDNLYTDTPINLIKSNSIPTNIKKVIIEVKVSVEDAVKLLESNISNNLKDHIIDKVINSVYDVDKVIKSNAVPDDIKEKTVILKINKSNVLSSLKWLWGESETLIKNLKSKEIEEIINEQNENTILDKLNDYDTPRDICHEIIKRKHNELIHAITNADVNKIIDLLNREVSKEIVDLIIQYRSNDIHKILDTLDDYKVLSLLNSAYLPDEYKEYIIEKHPAKIRKRIKELRKSEIDLYYIRHDTKLPKKVILMVMEEHKAKILEDIENYTEEQVINNLKYAHYVDIINEMMIDLRINENNIFELLSNHYANDHILELVIKKKKSIIRNYLEKLDTNALFTLRDINNFSAFVKDLIIDNNKDFYQEKINELDTETKYDLLNNKRTIEEVKKIILNSFNIADVNLNVIVDLLSMGNTKLILENFDKIKEFITKNNIDFESFIQYGSGSKKYENWLDNIMNIISNNESDAFIKCKEYFFDYYYTEDNEKENQVYLIKNYLELLENYEKYKDLCLNLTSQSKDLTATDKSNIAFLFNIKNIPDIELPKNLDELNEFKSKIYEEYLLKVLDENITEEEIKNIFNDLILCNSNVILNYIGGTGALRTIKKDNSNSNNIIHLVDELMSYSEIIEKINDSNDLEGLKKILEYAFTDINTLTKMQNLFSAFERNITKLYELDSMNNLTKLSLNKDVDGVLNYDLMEKYGGEVYDYSDKNYALYAHVVSHREDIENIINGVASGKSNFISVSPISYRGQKYYWDKSEVIVAYDKIPNGSFICSSIDNMGSNGKIIKNSSEVNPINRMQRGILETSTATRNNSEALLYREGLKPCGLILPGGREPTPKEIEYHNKFNLPFIITQEIARPIDSPKMVLKRSDSHHLTKIKANELEEIKKLLKGNLNIKKENDEYTGREVAIITDCHSMYEPTLAVLEDMRRNGIEEIYSLGDNVGAGPNPTEVFDLLEDYNVVSVAGNSEYYNTLGTEPFNYFTPEKTASQKWTESKLGPERIKKLKVYPASIDIMVGDKKIALCHFINDVRWDYTDHGTYAYQRNYDAGLPSRQFLYTNSEAAKQKVNNTLISNKKQIPAMRGYQSSKDEPIFEGKKITDYDVVIQGHVHFEMDEFIDNVDVLTMRAVGMGYKDDPTNMACYYVLKERKDKDFDLEKRLVPFNRNSLLSSIKTSDIPNKQLILKFVEPTIKVGE